MTEFSILISSGENMVLMNKRRLSKDSLKPFSINDGHVEYKTKFSISEWPSGHDKTKLDAVLAHNKVIFERLNENLVKVKESLLEEPIKPEQGHKASKPSDIELLRKASVLTKGSYWTLSNFHRKSLYIRREIAGEKKGSAMETGTNFSLDLYRDDKETLKARLSAG